MSYIGTEPKDIRSFGRTKFDYTATQGQTAFTGADDDGKVLAFTVGQIEVYVNGILMDDSDFTTTGTGTVTLASAANLNDVINIVSFETNIPDSDYVPASGGTFSGNVSMSGTLGVTGAVTASNGLTVDDDGATPLTVDRATSNGTLVDFQKDGSSVGSISTASELAFNTTTGYASLKVNSEGDGLQYSNVGTRHFGPWLSKDNAVDLGRTNGRFKDAYLGGGVYLGGTNAANKLDFYQEGTFTYNMNCGTSGSFTPRSGYTLGHYTRIGNIVHYSVRFESISKSSPQGRIQLGNFPFTFKANITNGAVAQDQAVVLRGNNPSSNYMTYFFVPVQGGNYGYFTVRENNSAFGYSVIDQSQISGNFEGMLNITTLIA
jgi:hypothetical protein